MASKRPVGVTILMVLAYIGAVLAVIGGIAMFVGGGFLSSLSTVPGVSALIGAGAVVMGIVLIALGVLYYFIAKGLGDGKNWARIVTLVFSALGFIGSIWPISIVGLIINGVIIWYLWFNKEAVAYFK